MKKKKYATNIPVIIFLIALFAIGFITPYNFDGMDLSIIFQSVLLCSISILTFYFNIIIHEIGHIVLGVIGGYEFKEMIIGLFKICKENGKLKIKKEDKFKGTGFYGQAILNINTENFQKDAVIKMLLGGGLFNLIASIITFIIFFITENPYLKEIYIINTILGLVLFILNLGVYKSKYLINDGYWIYSLLKDNEAVNLLLIEFDLQEGSHIMELDDKCLLESKEAASKYCTMALEYYRYLKLIFNNEKDRAKEKIENIIEFENKYDITPIAGNMFTYTHDIFYYYAVIEEDKEKAKEYYKKNKKIIEESNAPTKARALATYEVKINSNLEKAKEIFQKEIQKSIDKNKDLGLIQFERDLVYKFIFNT